MSAEGRTSFMMSADGARPSSMTALDRLAACRSPTSHQRPTPALGPGQDLRGALATAEGGKEPPGRRHALRSSLRSVLGDRLPGFVGPPHRARAGQRVSLLLQVKVLFRYASSRSWRRPRARANPDSPLSISSAVAMTTPAAHFAALRSLCSMFGMSSIAWAKPSIP